MTTGRNHDLEMVCRRGKWDQSICYLISGSHFPLIKVCPTRRQLSCTSAVQLLWCIIWSTETSSRSKISCPVVWHLVLPKGRSKPVQMGGCAGCCKSGASLLTSGNSPGQQQSRRWVVPLERRKQLREVRLCAIHSTIRFHLPLSTAIALMEVLSEGLTSLEDTF